MNKVLAFDDVLITPRFSSIISRKDVDTSVTFLGEYLETPIMSSNMDTVTEYQMAQAMVKSGGIGCLHRFMSIEDNIKQMEQSPQGTFVSVGLGNNELERAKALYDAGAYNFMVDVAHGASVATVAQYERLRELLPDANIVVGNFATADSVKEFNRVSRYKLQAIKVSIGSGSMCTTRIVTGCGLPTLASILECKSLGIPMIADGGIKNSGDIAKALAAGADLVMLGRLLAGTDETPGEVLHHGSKIMSKEEHYKFINETGTYIPYSGTHVILTEGIKAPFGSKPTHKQYRGSASKESYEAQGKEAIHRTPEGESTLVPYKGSVEDVMNNLTAGLKSSLSYVGANNLDEFKENARLVEVTSNGNRESYAHGKS